jgi:hypothetical protein
MNGCKKNAAFSKKIKHIPDSGIISPYKNLQNKGLRDVAFSDTVTSR